MSNQSDRSVLRVQVRLRQGVEGRGEVTMNGRSLQVQDAGRTFLIAYVESPEIVWQVKILRFSPNNLYVQFRVKDGIDRWVSVGDLAVLDELPDPKTA